MNQLKIIFLSLGAAFFFPAPNSCYAASFDCSKSSTFVEKAICSDTEISSLDDSLASAYREVIAISGKADNIKREQRNWLKNRNLCKNADCLKNLYRQRINALVNINPLPKKPGECIDSKIVGKFTRFEGAIAGEAGGEAVVSLEKNVGLYIQSVSGLPENTNVDKYIYSTVDFNKGDRVKLCLVALPENCPPGDNRGKIYEVKNYKNGMSFVGIDSWHSCGGA